MRLAMKKLILILLFLPQIALSECKEIFEPANQLIELKIWDMAPEKKRFNVQIIIPNHYNNSQLNEVLFSWIENENSLLPAWDAGGTWVRVYYWDYPQKADSKFSEMTIPVELSGKVKIQAIYNKPGCPAYWYTAQQVIKLPETAKQSIK